MKNPTKVLNITATILKEMGGTLKKLIGVAVLLASGAIGAQTVNISPCPVETSIDCVTGIDGLDVLGASYNMTVLNGTFNDLFSDPASQLTSWGDSAWGQGARQAIANALNSLDPIPMRPNTKFVEGGQDDRHESILHLPEEYQEFNSDPMAAFNGPCVVIRVAGSVVPSNCGTWLSQNRLAFATFIPAVGNEPPTDGDGDGIEDAIDGTLNGVFNDQSTVFSNDFTDQHLGGLTFGSIIARNGDIVTVVDDPAAGVILSGNGIAGGLPQLVRACTNPVVDIFLNDGDTIIATCGSFLGETLAGPVTVTVGINIDVTIPAGAIAFIEELPGSILSISHLGGSGTPDIVIDDKGVVTNLGSDDSPLVTILDSDDDGVPDGDDVCPATVIPESVATVRLGTNRWALADDDFEFDTTAAKGKGPGRSYSTADTAGCSCEQIIVEQGLGNGHTKFGCSISAMDDWVKLVN